MDVPPPSTSPPPRRPPPSSNNNRDSTAADLHPAYTNCNRKEKTALRLSRHPSRAVSRIRKKRAFGDSSATASSSSTSSSLSTSSSSRRSLRLARNHRNPRRSTCLRRNEFEATGFPLGMSIAATFARFLEETDACRAEISPDRLSMIFSFAVRESLSNASGSRFKCFVKNLERSFDCTLKTLLRVNEATESKTASSRPNHPDTNEDFQDCSSSIIACSCSSVNSCSNIPEERILCLPRSNLELSLRDGITNEDRIVPNRFQFPESSSVLSCVERSVTEQSRSNDLKAFEIGLKLQKMKMKEEEISLITESNNLGRHKLAVDISNVSFKTEKLMNRLEETRNAELLRKCVDCLVASLLIMSSSLCYGAYVHSYRRIVEATTSCTLPKERSSKSWWIPKPVSSLSSDLHVLRCQAQVLSRMVFGVMVILSVAYLLLQRSSGGMRQSMPITFIVLLLGVVCGFVGKMCVDTLGGDGYHWLAYWEILCVVHFFACARTSSLFILLHGPVVLSGASRRSLFPHSVRRVVYYSSILVILPVLCGFMPFATVAVWKRHFLSLLTDIRLRRW